MHDVHDAAGQGANCGTARPNIAFTGPCGRMGGLIGTAPSQQVAGAWHSHVHVHTVGCVTRDAKACTVGYIN